MQMTMEQLNTITNTTGVLLESPVEEFILYLEDTKTLGDLLGLKNYLEAEYERVRQVKDLLVNRCEQSEDPEKVKDTISQLFTVLALIENRRDIIVTFINNRKPVEPVSDRK